MTALCDTMNGSPIFKKQASTTLRAAVQRIEDRSDMWLDGQAILDFPRDAAVWGVLTQVTELIEQHIEQYGHGSQKQREAMINLGRDGALLLENLLRREFPQKAAWLRWTPALREAAKVAVLSAHNYQTFASCFRMWHKGRQRVEVLSPTRLRFSATRSATDRRIRAQQQGARIQGWPSTRDNPVDKSFVNDPDVALLLSRLAAQIQLDGALAMHYPDDSELLSVLRDIFDIRLRSAFRRNASLDLGGYDLSDVRRVFAVLYSLSAVHEYLCDLWRKMCGRYPFESAVMMRPLDGWVGIASCLSRVAEASVRRILADLTFGAIRPLDIYIHPFVPSSDRRSLFLIPHFVLNTRPEENILRVCSYARPKYYSVISNAKEGEMRDHIQLDAPSRYKISGPFKPSDSNLPDIDLVITDPKNAAVLIGELKWVRKAAHVLEHLDRDAELEKGFRQLHAIRAFLLNNPTFLRDVGVVKTKKGKPQISYFVIARDHMIDKLEDDGIWLAEFDALIWSLRQSRSLTAAIRRLKRLEWLPKENREFEVTFESSSVAGVAIETETFHRPPDLAAPGMPNEPISA